MAAAEYSVRYSTEYLSAMVRVLDFVMCFIFSKPYMNISLKIEYQSGIIETQSVAKADN